MSPFRRMLLIVGLLSPAFAHAQEPNGCDMFKWPLVHERAALSAPQATRLQSGAVLAFDAAASVHLAPLAEAKLEMAPERAPKASPSFAGAIKLDAPAAAGLYKVSLSDPGLDRRHPGRTFHQAGRFHRRAGLPGPAQEREVPA